MTIISNLFIHWVKSRGRFVYFHFQAELAPLSDQVGFRGRGSYRLGNSRSRVRAGRVGPSSKCPAASRRGAARKMCAVLGSKSGIWKSVAGKCGNKQTEIAIGNRKRIVPDTTFSALVLTSDGRRFFSVFPGLSLFDANPPLSSTGKSRLFI